ncbi:hypothetical protein G6F22_017334 [Rhizopus arrhizus]|nr:hypothetical protein G6F22_017334 [Rhizopus arrhizus]
MRGGWANRPAGRCPVSASRRGGTVDGQGAGRQRRLVLDRAGIEPAAQAHFARLAEQRLVQAGGHGADIAFAVQHQPAGLHAFEVVLARAHGAIHRPVRRHVEFGPDGARPFLGLPVGP